MFGERTPLSGLQWDPVCHPEPFASLKGKLREGLRVTGIISKYLLVI